MGTENAAYLFEHDGYCIVCDRDVRFSATARWLRDAFKCPNCDTIPRQRALMKVLTDHFPGWRDLQIHEGSPGWDMLSRRLSQECKGYVASQYNPNLKFGELYEYNLPSRVYRNENLENQSFPDNFFDIVITQDVFEHVFNPDKAIQEIARTLKPGGATIMSVPIVMKSQNSRRRSALLNGEVINIIEPAQYHGNPVDKKGALVTIDWGYDIVGYLQKHSNLIFTMIQIDDLDLGIRAELIEILIGFKKEVPLL